MILVASSNFDNIDYDILTVEEWNSLIVLLNKLRGCKSIRPINLSLFA